MGIKSWWRNADPVGKAIVKWFGVAVALAILVTLIKLAG